MRVRSAENDVVEIEGGLDGAKMTKADAVYRSLTVDIVSGHLAPGTKLAFDMLKRRYGAGLSPIREALQRLTSEHLVTVESHVGFRVAPVSRRDLEEINSLRLQLEVQALRDSFSHGDLGWEASVVTAAHMLNRTPIPVDDDSPEAEKWEEQHRLFHDALISKCQARWTLRFCRILFAQFRRYRRVILHRYWSSPPLREVIDAEHQRLVDAVVARDVEAAVATLTEHYENSGRRVLQDYELAFPADPN